MVLEYSRSQWHLMLGDQADKSALCARISYTAEVSSGDLDAIQQD